MSRLNASIKLLFACGELLFLAASIVCFFCSAMVASGRLPAFAFPLAQKISIVVLLISGASLACSCFGCCAVLRQTKRRGCFSGRRMLCMHLLLLGGILFFGITQLQFLEMQETRMAAIIDKQDSFPEYNAFERHVSSWVNNLYFSAYVKGSSTTEWLVQFVQKHCPKRMSHERCGEEESTSVCDFSSKMCCPNESLCTSGVKDACPYENCRGEILGKLYEFIVPMRIGASLVCLLSLLMIMLSCLLVCFNKRDEIEIELFKTGNISEDDIEAIRRLKSNKTRGNAVGHVQPDGPRFRPNRQVRVSPNEIA